MYRITTGHGNGYHCSCCRQTWEGQKEFETKEEVLKYLIEFEASRLKAPEDDKWNDDDDDKWIEEIVVVEDETLTDRFMAEIKDEVTKIVEEARGEKEASKKEKEASQKRANVTKEKEKLKELAMKYPEELKKMGEQK